MIRLGDCADCQKIEWKAVWCEVKLHHFQGAIHWHQTNEERNWAYVPHDQPYHSVVCREIAGTFPNFYYIYHTYTIDEITGAITSPTGPTWGASIVTEPSNRMYNIDPFDGGLELAISEVNQVSFDDLEWNTGVAVRWNYGVREVLPSSVAGANVFGFSNLRKGSAIKRFALASKFQIRVDGKYCVVNQDWTNDLRQPGWNGVPNVGWTETTDPKLKDCESKKVVTVRTPDFYGRSDCYVEPCVSCPPAPAAISPAICYPAP